MRSASEVRSASPPGMKVRIETGDSEPTRGGAGAMGPKDPESVRPWGGDLGTWRRCGVNRVRGRGCGDSKTATHDLGGGGAEGIRTPDLLIANETLYQLSYDPVHKRR